MKPTIKTALLGIALYAPCLLFGQYTGGIGKGDAGAATSTFAPLPVSWLDIHCGRKGTHAVEVQWKTAVEEGSRTFYIQRSFGGKFQDIDSIAGAGNNFKPKSYSYTDQSASVGTLFYRIRQLDQDGRQSYSDVCATAQATSGELRVMNNPADREFKVWTPAVLEGTIYRLVNAAGHEVNSGYLLSGTTAIPTLMLPSGCYSFQVMNADNPYFIRVLVLHP